MKYGFQLQQWAPTFYEHVSLRMPHQVQVPRHWRLVKQSVPAVNPTRQWQIYN